MKKVLTLMTSVAMLGACALTASASSVTKTKLPDSEDIGVNAMYSDKATYVDNYSVTIEWGKMEFTYLQNGTMTWNTETHQYDHDGENGWTPEGNTITVTNDSSKPVDAAFSFKALDDYSKTVTGTFSSGTLSLESALDGKAKSDSTALTLDGTLSSNVTAMTQVGTVTVTLSEGK